MKRAAAWLLASLVFAAPLTHAATAALTDAQQARLDRAVIDQAEGRRGAACRAFEALARQGVPAAAYNLAVLQLDGQLPGVGVRQARRWLERAAGGGFVTAMLALGQLHEGERLGRRDLAASLRWYERAAEAGDGDAQLAAGTAHYLGRGTVRSGPEALRWFRAAALQGDVGAQYLVASMYEQGDGVERDLRLARYWYDAAAKNGDVAAPGKRQQIDAAIAAAAAASTAPP